MVDLMLRLDLVVFQVNRFGMVRPGMYSFRMVCLWVDRPGMVGLGVIGLGVIGLGMIRFGMLDGFVLGGERRSG